MVIPECFYKSEHDTSLQSAEHSMTGAGQQPLKVQGKLMGHFRHNTLKAEQKEFVIQGHA